jgi:hypothetical protein
LERAVVAVGERSVHAIDHQIEAGKFRFSPLLRFTLRSGYMEPAFRLHFHSVEFVEFAMPRRFTLVSEISSGSIHMVLDDFGRSTPKHAGCG